MSAERSTDSIIDLLYGELSEEETAEMREELGESPELQAELTTYQALLDRVRESMPIEEVSPSIHASIMEASRVALEQADGDRLVRRPAEPARGGFWKRAARGQGSQFALVAAVFIAGLFVVKLVDQGSSPTRVSASDISSMREPAPALAAAEKVSPVGSEEAEEAAAPGALADKIGGGGEAVADQWTADSPKPTEPSPRDDAEADRSLRKELARSGKKDANKVEKPRATSTTRRKAKKRKAKSTKSPAAPKKAAELGSMLNTDLFGGDDGLGVKNEQRSKSGGKDLDRRVQGKSGVATAANTPASGALDKAADEEPQEQYRPPANSISAVNSYFRENDYTGAIRAADEFLVTEKKAPAAEKARALHVKAQALAKVGRYTEADRIYKSMQKNYPSYQSAIVNNAREELKRRKTRKRSKKKARPKMDQKESASPDSYDSILK